MYGSMKLPAENELKTEKHRELRARDAGEFYARDLEKNFWARFYQSRVQLILKTVEAGAARMGKKPAEIRVLDVGCAQGNFSAAFAEKGYEVVALDYQREFLTYARIKCDKGRAFYVEGDFEKFPFRGASFDIVLATEVIEHVTEPCDFLKRLAALCRPGGMIVLTTPNGGRFFTGLPTWDDVKDHELKARPHQPDAEGHLFLMTKEELIREGKRAGLVPEGHVFLATPWLTGRLGMRYFIRWLPFSAAGFLDKVFLSVPLLTEKIAEIQAVVFRQEGKR